MSLRGDVSDELFTLFLLAVGLTCLGCTACLLFTFLGLSLSILFIVSSGFGVLVGGCFTRPLCNE